MTSHINELTRLTAELEGLLRVLAHRDNPDIRQLIKDKYAELTARFGNFNDEFLASPVEEEILEDVIHDAGELEAKEQEAVSYQVEPEFEAAEAAVEHGEEVQEENMPQSLQEENVDTLVQELDAPGEQEEPIVPVSLGELQTAEPESAEQADARRLSVDQMLAHKEAGDLKKVFTLNDKFRFRRALFNQDDAAFAEALQRFSECSTLAEAENFARTSLGWNFDNPDQEDFFNIIAPHYKA